MAFDPWVGSGFAQTGLLVVSESAYSWDEDGGVKHPPRKQPSDTVEDAVRKFDEKDGFRRRATQTLAGKKALRSPNAKERGISVRTPPMCKRLWVMVHDSSLAGDVPRGTATLSAFNQ